MTPRLLAAPAPLPPPLVIVLVGLPPALNHQYVTLRQGGRRLTPEAAAWQAGAAQIVRIFVREAGWAVPPRTGLAVTVAFTDPRMLTWDLDGRLKCLIDSLAAGLGVDDRWVMALTVTKARGPAATVLTVAAVPAEAAA